MSRPAALPHDAPHVEYYAIPGAVMIVCRHSGACGGCHTARFVFVNRGGATRCALCDHEQLTEACHA